MKISILSATFLLSAVATAQAQCKVDQAGYDALEFGMSVEEVGAVFGCAAGTATEAKIATGAAVAHDWTDADTGARVTTVFKGGELRSMIAPN